MHRATASNHCPPPASQYGWSAFGGESPPVPADILPCPRGRHLVNSPTSVRTRMNESNEELKARYN